MRHFNLQPQNILYRKKKEKLYGFLKMLMVEQKPSGDPQHPKVLTIFFHLKPQFPQKESSKLANYVPRLL